MQPEWFTALQVAPFTTDIEVDEKFSTYTVLVWGSNTAANPKAPTSTSAKSEQPAVVEALHTEVSKTARMLGNAEGIYNVWVASSTVAGANGKKPTVKF